MLWKSGYRFLFDYLEWDGGKYFTGIYFCRLLVDGNEISREITMIK
ncbi:MAG: hypothetical protein JSU85_01345 [Candidatus Zixiibacteriota bacterium]|nr:MAG: hypothetical protein JSU85_01345 [candidate division Zixibacteria bacterium]